MRSSQSPAAIFQRLGLPDSPVLFDVRDNADFAARPRLIPGALRGDPDRVILAGHSAGAYNAMMVALQPERFGAGGLKGRIKGLIGLSGPYDFYPYDVKQSIDAFGTFSDPPSTQPINLVTPDAPPMLLAHGVRDTTVGDYHTVRLAAKLRENGVPVIERHYTRLMHAPVVLGLTTLLRPLLPVYGDVRNFLLSRRNAG